MTNWAKRTKEGVEAQPLVKEKADRGKRFEAVLEGTELEFYKTGSFGVTFKYQIAGNKWPLRKRIVLRKPDAEGNMAATQYGESDLKRALMALGLDAGQVAAFPIPKVKTDAKAIEILNTLAGSKVAAYVKEREYMGKIQQDIGAIFPLGGN